jgi:hypothetical protein
LTDLACIARLSSVFILEGTSRKFLGSSTMPTLNTAATQESTSYSTRMDEPDRFVPWQRATERNLETGSVVITELTVSDSNSSSLCRGARALGALS